MKSSLTLGRKLKKESCYKIYYIEVVARLWKLQKLQIISVWNRVDFKSFLEPKTLKATNLRANILTTIKTSYIMSIRLLLILHSTGIRAILSKYSLPWLHFLRRKSCNHQNTLRYSYYLLTNFSTRFPKRSFVANHSTIATRLNF